MKTLLQLLKQYNPKMVKVARSARCITLSFLFKLTYVSILLLLAKG